MALILAVKVAGLLREEANLIEENKTEEIVKRNKVSPTPDDQVYTMQQQQQQQQQQQYYNNNGVMPYDDGSGYPVGGYGDGGYGDGGYGDGGYNGGHMATGHL